MIFFIPAFPHSYEKFFHIFTCGVALELVSRWIMYYLVVPKFYNDVDCAMLL
jgi:hypothetical protein